MNKGQSRGGRTTPEGMGGETMPSWPNAASTFAGDVPTTCNDHQGQV